NKTMICFRISFTSFAANHSNSTRGKLSLLRACTKTMSFWHPGEPPAPESYHGPHSFHRAKGPRALQKSIDRAQGTGKGKRKDEPCAPLFQSVEDQHGCNGKESE